MLLKDTKYNYSNKLIKISEICMCVKSWYAYSACERVYSNRVKDSYSVSDKVTPVVCVEYEFKNKSHSLFNLEFDEIEETKKKVFIFVTGYEQLINARDQNQTSINAKIIKIKDVSSKKTGSLVFEEGIYNLKKLIDKYPCKLKDKDILLNTIKKFSNDENEIVFSTKSPTSKMIKNKIFGKNEDV